MNVSSFEMEIDNITFSQNATLAVRSGDYYLFEDLDEKVELDLLHQRPSAGIEDTITDRKMADKMTVEKVNFVYLLHGGLQFLEHLIHIRYLLTKIDHQK